MAIFDDIQKALYQGAGEEAKILGQRFDVYRHNELIITRHPVKVVRTNDKKAIEVSASLRSIVLMSLICDATDLKPGDLLVGEEATDRFIVASMRPMMPVIGFRVESQISLRRVIQAEAADPLTTNVDPYGGHTQPTDYILTYDPVSNTYGWESPDDSPTEAFIQAGVSQLNYTGQNLPLKLPMDTRVTRWIFVIPILPGVKLEEGDFIIHDEDRYQIFSVDKQVAGFNGQIVSTDLVRP